MKKKVIRSSSLPFIKENQSQYRPCRQKRNMMKFFRLSFLIDKKFKKENSDLQMENKYKSIS